jgi:hypothetical protein
MTTAISSGQSNHVAFNRLLWVGPLTILAAMIANTIVWQIAVAILQPDPQFMPLMFPVPFVFTFFGVLAAVIAFAVIGRISKNPIALFRRVALIALVVSFVPDLMMLLTGSFPGTTLANVLALMLMHVVAYALSVYMLTRWASA